MTRIDRSTVANECDFIVDFNHMYYILFNAVFRSRSCFSLNPQVPKLMFVPLSPQVWSIAISVIFIRFNFIIFELRTSMMPHLKCSAMTEIYLMAWNFVCFNKSIIIFGFCSICVRRNIEVQVLFFCQMHMTFINCCWQAPPVTDRE